MAPDRKWVLEQFSTQTTKRAGALLKNRYHQTWCDRTTSYFAAAVMFTRHVLALVESGHLAKVQTDIRSYIRIK